MRSEIPKKTELWPIEKLVDHARKPRRKDTTVDRIGRFQEVGHAKS